ALNNPVAALEFDPACRIQLVSAQTADQVHRLGALVAVAPHPPFEPRNQSRAGKTHLFGADLQAFQEPDLTPAPIPLPRQCAGLRRGPRGKISLALRVCPAFAPSPSGCL